MQNWRKDMRTLHQGSLDGRRNALECLQNNQK